MTNNKTLLKTIALCSSLALLYSCSKSKSNNVDQLSTLGKATISGKVSARLVDTAGASNNQVAPQGTIINVWIDSKEFLLTAYDSAPAYLPKRYVATVDGSGKYSVTVDVSPYQPATVHVEPADFDYATIMNKVGVIHHDSVYTVTQTYTSTPIPVSVKKDKSYTQDIFYSY